MINGQIVNAVSPIGEEEVCNIGLDRYRYGYRVSADTHQYLWVSVSADTYFSIGADTSRPVICLPVSTVNTVATHTCSFKPIPYFRTYIPHTYVTCTHLYPTQNRIFLQNFVQPGIGTGIGIAVAAANSIGYRAPARYRSNTTVVETICQRVVKKPCFKSPGSRFHAHDAAVRSALSARLILNVGLSLLVYIDVCSSAVVRRDSARQGCRRWKTGVVAVSGDWQPNTSCVLEQRI